MTSDVEHIFLYLLAICLSSLEIFIQILCPLKKKKAYFHLASLGQVVAPPFYM